MERYKKYKNTGCSYIWNEVFFFVREHKKEFKKALKFYIKKREKIEYYNVPVSFDIETTNFTSGDRELAYCYIWQFDICGYVFYGRYLDEFKRFLGELKEILKLSEKRKIVVYVHNLEYEMQFIRKMFKWNDIFALDTHKPIKATAADYGVEFKCSYKLSGLSLETMSEQTATNKKVGDLDYNLKRNSLTELSKKELDYCFSDVEVVVEYIKEMINNYGDLHHIPMTSTGKVRKVVKKAVRSSPKYKALIKRCPLTETEFIMLKRVFAGGYTHANAEYVGKIMYNVFSYDLTSSYPAVCCYEPEFPISKGYEIYPKSKKHFNYLLNKYCCIFEVEFFNIYSSFLPDNYISSSKCSVLENPIINNGRVVGAEHLIMCVTNIDFEIIQKVYEWDKIKIGKIITYEKGYLPKEFILQVLQWFSDKTKLKGIDGEEKTYMLLKTYINSLYGMCVTSIDKPEISYNNDNEEWEKEDKTLTQVINEYNSSGSRFLLYQWGIYITALARRVLWNAIINLKYDYIYSDTDSVKFINNHNDYFEKTNAEIKNKLLTMCEHYKIDTSLIFPKNNKGKEYCIGLWDYEGQYKAFKTLGAKRYIVIDEYNKPHLTISGLNIKGKKYIVNKYGKYGMFKAFKNEMSIDGNNTGKLTHKYIDEPVYNIELTDYKGQTQKVDILSCIYLTGAPFSMSLSKQFLKYLYNVQEEVNGI